MKKKTLIPILTAIVLVICSFITVLLSDASFAKADDNDDDPVFYYLDEGSWMLLYVQNNNDMDRLVIVRANNEDKYVFQKTDSNPKVYYMHSYSEKKDSFLESVNNHDLQYKFTNDGYNDSGYGLSDIHVSSINSVFDNTVSTIKGDCLTIDYSNISDKAFFCDFSKTTVSFGGDVYSPETSQENDEKLVFKNIGFGCGINEYNVKYIVYDHQGELKKTVSISKSNEITPELKDVKLGSANLSSITELTNGSYTLSFSVSNYPDSISNVKISLIDKDSKKTIIDNKKATKDDDTGKYTYDIQLQDVPVGHELELSFAVKCSDSFETIYKTLPYNHSFKISSFNELSAKFASNNAKNPSTVATIGDEFTITLLSEKKIDSISSTIESKSSTYGTSSSTTSSSSNTTADDKWTETTDAEGNFIYTYVDTIEKSSELRYLNISKLQITTEGITDCYDSNSFEKPLYIYPKIDISSVKGFGDGSLRTGSSFSFDIKYIPSNKTSIIPDFKVVKICNYDDNTDYIETDIDIKNYKTTILIDDIMGFYNDNDSVKFKIVVEDPAGNISSPIEVESNYIFYADITITEIRLDTDNKATYTDSNNDIWRYANNDSKLTVVFKSNHNPVTVKVYFNDNTSPDKEVNQVYRSSDGYFYLTIDKLKDYNLNSGVPNKISVTIADGSDQLSLVENLNTDIIYLDDLKIDYSLNKDSNFLSSDKEIGIGFEAEDSRDFIVDSLCLYYSDPGDPSNFKPIKIDLPEDNDYGSEFSQILSMKLLQDTGLDDLKLFLSATAQDRSGNEDIIYQDLGITYFRPISESISEIEFKSDNNSFVKSDKTPDLSYVKNGDTLTVCFKSSHPLGTEEDKMVTYESNYAITGKINDDDVSFYSMDRYTWYTDYKYFDLSNWDDGKEVTVSLELYDASSNDAYVLDNSLFQNEIIYYAPISISNLTFVSSNEGTGGLYANDNDTVALSFDTTHYLSSVLYIADKFPYFECTGSEDGIYHYKAELPVSDLTLEDNNNISYTFKLWDAAANTPLEINEPDTNAHVIYQAPITVSDLSIKSNNVSSDLLAKDGDNINVSFTTKHPVNIVSAKAAGIDIPLSSENNDGMHWSGTISVPNGIVSDNAHINVRIELGDISGNDNYVIENSDIQYYAPISISSTTIVTDNANDKSKYAIDGNTVTVSFITNHKIDLSSSSFSLAGHSGIAASETALEGGMYKYVFARKIANGELVDLSTVAFSISVTDIAKNNAVTANEKSSGVINSITYYAPLDIKTTIASSGVNTGYAKNGDTVTISAAANHNASVSSATLSDRTMAASGNDTTALKITYTIDAGEKNLKEGKLATALNFTDVAGNTFTVDAVNEGTVIYDRTSPAIDVKDAFSGFSAADISFNINIIDENIDREKTKIDVNGSALKIGNGITENGTTYSAFIQNEEDGTYTIVISATDLAGNVADPVKYTVTVDKTNPKITVTTFYSSSNKIYKPGLVIADLFDLDEDNMAEISCTISDGSSVTDWDINEPLVTDGKKTISVIAVDKAGNASEQLIFDVFIDGTAPNPILKDNISNKTLEVGLNEFDEKASIVFTLQALSYSSEPDKFTKLIITLPDGTTVDLIESDHVDSNGDYYYDFDSAGDYKVTLAAVDDLGNSTGDITYEIKVNEKPLDAIKRVLDISGDEKASIAGVTFSVKTIAIIVGSALGGTALIIAVLLIIRKKRHR